MLLALQLNNLLQSGGASDTTPDAFSFTDQSGVATSATITSAAITVTGIDAASAITITGGTYSINGGAYTASAGTVVNGDSVTVRHTSSASYLTATNTVLTIGGVSDTFTSTTLADPGVYSTATYRGGTAMSASGMMGTLFLNDATAIPAGSYFHGGIAHHPDGTRYVALWPANDAVRYHGGIGVRQDGAMLILVGGTAVARHGGIGCTARGEVIAAISAPTIVHNGYGLLADGTLCMSDVS